MSGASGKSFGIIGALAAFPRRLASREVDRQGGTLRRGATRRTSHVVFTRSLLEKASEAEIAARFDAQTAAGRVCLSEKGFLRLLGLSEPPGGASLSRQSLIDQSRLPDREMALLSLFDAFEHDAEPFSFRDLILAKKYAGLASSGASWGAIAKSVRRSASVTSLTALSLHLEEETVYARFGEDLGELDGQMLFALGPGEIDDIEELFAWAEAAEADARYAEAAMHYRRCLALDPGDSVAAFNMANCLRACGSGSEAAAAFMLALKLDPGFAEAWFNLGGLSSDRGQTATARDYLRKAIALDPDYADAVYNLATLEYDLGNLGAARRWWLRYLELDKDSDWAKTALRGVQYVDLAQKSAG